MKLLYTYEMTAQRENPAERAKNLPELRRVWQGC